LPPKGETFLLLRAGKLKPLFDELDLMLATPGIEAPGLNPINRVR
jgi:hypothetical protein